MISCIDKHLLVDNKCIEWDDKCTNYSGSVCTECEYGYLTDDKNDNKCMPILDTCLDKESLTDDCSLCQYG